MNLNFAVWLILGLIWGSTWLVIKIGLDESLPPLTFAWMRFAIAVIPLIALLWARKIPIWASFRQYWWLLLLTGLFQTTLNYGLVFWGEQYIESGLTATLYTTLPLFSLVFAHLLLATERITLPRLLGVLIGIGGVALIFSKQLELTNEMAFWGSAAVLLASLGMGFSQTLLKKYGREIDPTLVAASQMGFGLIPLLILGLFLEGSPLNVTFTAKGVISIVYLAVIGSSLAFGLLYWLIRRIDVTIVALTPLVSTLAAVLLGMIVLGESFTWREISGGVLIVSGLLLTTLRRKSKQQVETRPLASPTPSSD